MARVSGNRNRSSWKKWPFWGAAGLMIAGVGSRLFVSTIEALIDHEVTVDLIMTIVVVLVIAAGMVFFVKYFRELGDFDYDPPLGKSPSMPGYYEEHYEGRDVRVNAYGELVPAGGPGDPMGRKQASKGGSQFYSTGAGAAEQFMVTPVFPEWVGKKGAAANVSDPTGGKVARALAGSGGSGGSQSAAPTSPPRGTAAAKARRKRKVRGYIKAGRAVDAEVEVGPALSADGTIFIRGRLKTMLLSSNGQNIYPEEIEAKLNNMRYVSESLVVEREGKLVALVYPDYETMDQLGTTRDQLPEIMEGIRVELNKLVAPYERIAKIQLIAKEFEKTPKRSIKRYLYSS